MDTEFYKFSFDKDKIAVRIGDINDFNEYVMFNPEGKVLKGEDLNVIFTYGIPQIASTFDCKEIRINTKTDCPGWFWVAVKDKYLLALLIPPYEEEE